MTITTETILLTPAMAAEFLTHNTGNRPIRKQRVEQIARDILNGKWVFDGAAITFDAEGNLRGNGDPLVTMTRRVQRDISDKRTISQARGLFYLFRTWNAFRTGEVMQKIQVGNGAGNPARIPDPK